MQIIRIIHFKNQILDQQKKEHWSKAVLDPSLWKKGWGGALVWSELRAPDAAVQWASSHEIVH